MTARSLDITGLTCPMTWVRTKLELERMAAGEALDVRCRPGEALENVPRSAREAGHRVAVDGTTIRIVRVSGASRRGFFRDLAAAVASAREAVEPEVEPEEPAARIHDLSDPEIERYSRQLVLPEWGAAAQLALSEANVLVIGAGALGSPVAGYLAGAGVGRLGIVDDDAVELSNLHRQLLHFTPDLGVPKAESAAAKLRFLNPEVLIEPYQVRVEAENVAGLIEGQDLVVDCSDSFATRYAVNAACCAAGVRLVEAGVLGMAGMVMSIKPGRTACYRCAFPAAPADAPRCADAGVLGPAAGVIGSLQALEAMKLLTGVAPAIADGFLQVDLATSEFLRVHVGRRADCPDCSDRSAEG